MKVVIAGGTGALGRRLADACVFAVVGAHRRLAASAVSASRIDEAIAHAAAILDMDAYDERTHELLVRTLDAAGRRGDAARADGLYQKRMGELGVRPRSLLGAEQT